MDALSRLVSVATPLLRDVDTALATLGAPANHRVWGLLRRVGATPTDAAMFITDLEPQRLRAAATMLREQAAAYAGVPVPVEAPWEGAAAAQFTATASTLNAHLVGAESDSMAGRLRAMAEYADSVAEWQQRSRESLAAVLAEVLTSRQAMTVRSYPSLGSGPLDALRQHDTSGLTAAVLAAADIGAALLGVAEDLAAAGRQLINGAPAFDELPLRAPVDDAPISHTGPIRLR